MCIPVRIILIPLCATETFYFCVFLVMRYLYTLLLMKAHSQKRIKSLFQRLVLTCLSSLPYTPGVSGVLLLLAIFGAFLPTFFYLIYGNYELNCDHCVYDQRGPDTMDCDKCTMLERDLKDDYIFMQEARFICVCLFALTYTHTRTLFD